MLNESFFNIHHNYFLGEGPKPCSGEEGGGSDAVNRTVYRKKKKLF
jgi:hypothetical protein